MGLEGGNIKKKYFTENKKVHVIVKKSEEF
jgi:hypothetical protein